MSEDDGHVVDLLVEAPAWLEALPDLADAAEAAARAALAEAGLAPEGCTIAVLACDDAGIARLNAGHRGRQGPTNVLSWPAFPLAPALPGSVPPLPPGARQGVPLHLGDVAIALQTAAREAQSRSISLKSHATHLILHGCLHLLGYDHEREEDAALMEGTETRILIGLGLDDPYLIDDADAGLPHPDR